MLYGNWRCSFGARRDRVNLGSLHLSCGSSTSILEMLSLADKAEAKGQFVTLFSLNVNGPKETLLRPPVTRRVPPKVAILVLW
jgi:hypothetical protein